MKEQTIKEHIKSKGLTQKAFAELNEIKPQQITEWINKGFIVIDDILYSPRRKLKSVEGILNESL